jgi:hypothetical protein
MNSSVINIRMDLLIGALRPPGPSCWFRFSHRMVHFKQRISIMGQFIRGEYRFPHKATFQIVHKLTPIIQGPLPDQMADQKTAFGVKCRPNPPFPRFPIYPFCRTCLFFTKAHNSSNCTSVKCREVSNSDNTRPQCSPATSTTRLTVSLSKLNRRAVARTPTPSAAWWMIWLIFSGGKRKPKKAVECVSAKRLPQVRQYNKFRERSFPYLPRKLMFPPFSLP